jgi:hypothetical protein
VSAAGPAPLAYQWRCNGKDLPGATLSSITIPNLQLADCGWCSVVLSNQFGAQESAKAMLSVGQVAILGSGMSGETNVPPWLTNVVSVANSLHFMVLKTDGSITAWGYNTFGQAAVPPDASPAIAIACGSAHSLAVRADGTVAAWGYNYYQQTNVPPELTGVKAVAAGAQFSAALKNDGSARAWGRYLDTNAVSMPLVVPDNLADVTAMAAGANHLMLLRSDGTVLGFGDNSYGQLSVPSGLANIVGIACGDYHTLAWKSDGTLVAWGDNRSLQCDVPLGLSNVTACAGGSGWSVAARSDGPFVRWGSSLRVPAGLGSVAGISGKGIGGLALIATAPTVTIQPQDTLVTETYDATFTAAAIAVPLAAYQWRFNGTNLPGATGTTLVLTNVQFADRGYYSVLATNAFGSATSSNALLTVNRFPVARASATPNPAVSANGVNAAVLLDGLPSSDSDGDALQFDWFNRSTDTFLGSGSALVACLPVGKTTIALVVSDGRATNTTAIEATVLTTSEGVERIIDHLSRSGWNQPQPLLASLHAARASLSRGNIKPAANQLETFLSKVRAQVAPIDPALAEQLTRAAQQVLEALDKPAAVAQHRARLQSVARESNGKVRLQILAAPNQLHLVQCSTNCIDWVTVGIAVDRGNGSFEFGDEHAGHIPVRYYRVISP